MASRRRKVRRSIEATCPTCEQAVTAAGCFDGDPTPEQLAGFEEIALAVHAKIGCPGPDTAGDNVPGHDDQHGTDRPGPPRSEPPPAP